MKDRYDKERGRLWKRLYLAREKHNLLAARHAAALDLHTGLKVEEVIRLADFAASLRGIQFRAYAFPQRTNMKGDFDDLISVMSGAYSDDAGTQPYRDGLDDLFEEAFSWHESRKETTSADQGLTHDSGVLSRSTDTAFTLVTGE